MARNERLEDAIRQKGWTVTQLAERIEVDPKTVDRWVRKGRLPHPRSRLATGEALGVPPAVFWPEEAAVATGLGEIAALYRTRTEVAPATIRAVLSEASQSVDVLAYAGMWLWDGVPRFAETLAAKAANGVEVRVCLGEPDSDSVARRGAEEGIGSGMAARCRLALSYAAPVAAASPGAVRTSDATLYASILRFDADLFVNVHLWGNPAADSPVMHLRLGSDDDGVAANALRSFERVWERAHPPVG